MAMSIQGVMNTRLGEHIGLMESNAFVQCTAAALSIAALALYRTGSFSEIGGRRNSIFWAEFSGL